MKKIINYGSVVVWIIYAGVAFVTKVDHPYWWTVILLLWIAALSWNMQRLYNKIEKC